MPYMVPPTVGPAGPYTAPWVVRGTMYGATDGPTGPVIAPYMVPLDHHGAIHGPPGPNMAQMMVPSDHSGCHGWSPDSTLPCNVSPGFSLAQQVHFKAMRLA